MLTTATIDHDFLRNARALILAATANMTEDNAEGASQVIIAAATAIQRAAIGEDEMARDEITVATRRLAFINR